MKNLDIIRKNTLENNIKRVCVRDSVNGLEWVLNDIKPNHKEMLLDRLERGLKWSEIAANTV